MKSSRIILICLVVGAVLGSSFGAVASPTPEPPGPIPEPVGDGTTIVRVYYADLATRNKIILSFEAQLLQTNYEQGYHVLEVTEEDMNRLLVAGLRVEPDDTWVAPRVVAPEASAQTIPGYSCYRTVEETFAAAQALVTAHPDLATWTDVGNSWQKTVNQGGYDMMVLKLTNSAIAGDKPKLFINAAIHAREYATAELVTRLGEYLVNNYGIDADATWLLDYHEIHMLLQTNPDGRKKAESGQSWRKNTRDNCSYSLPPNGDGIDLNRNFSLFWKYCSASLGCSSGSACNATYRGTSAASEPETQAVESYLDLIFPDQKGANLSDPAPSDATGVYIDMHSYGMLVNWPWGFTSDLPPNATALQTLGRKFAYFNSHTPQQSIGLYPTDGDSIDHVYGKLGVAAYVFEVGTDFFQACSYFDNTLSPTNMPALIYAAKVARTPYLTPAGPDAITLTLSAGSVIAGEPVTLTASINDTRYNNSEGSEPTQNIAAAEYYVDVPPWSGGTAHAMAASDGSFNATVEGVTAAIDTTGWSEGKHILFMRGQDANGNWGAFSAIFLSTSGNPTSLQLSWFAATGEANGIELGWETTTEANTVGFNLYRALGPGGPKSQVNEDLIPSQFPPGSALGATYSYWDRTLKSGLRYFYWLENVDIYGHGEMHGPISAQAH